MFKTLIQISILIAVSFGLYKYYENKQAEGKDQVSEANLVQVEQPQKINSKEVLNATIDQAQVKAEMAKINSVAVKYYKSILVLFREMPMASSTIVPTELQVRIRDAKAKYNRAVELKRILPKKYNDKGESVISDIRRAYSKYLNKRKLSSHKKFAIKMKSWYSQRYIDCPQLVNNFSSYYKYTSNYDYRNGTYYYN